MDQEPEDNEQEEPEETEEDQLDQLANEIHGTIGRYTKESDITVYEILGVLEAIKATWIDALLHHDKDESN